VLESAKLGRTPKDDQHAGQDIKNFDANDSGLIVTKVHQFPIFLMAPRGVCSVPSLLMSKS
jgi:hypothetical protein